MRAALKQQAVIAEDEPLGRTLLAEAAEAAGLTPALFDNGTAALAAALAEKPAIALLDVEMPGLNGYEVCRRMRANAHLDAVPVVMVTGRDDAEAINYAFEAGATDFIAKPVNWSLLPHRLAYILRNAAAVRKLADREAKVTTLIAAIPDALWVVSPAGLLRWSPNKRSSATRYDASADAGDALEAIVPPEQVPAVARAIRETARDGQARKIEYRDRRPQATQRSSELRFSRCEDGDVLVVLQDTTERTAAAEHIERLAYFDPLTGLANRQRCIELAAKLLEVAERDDSGVGVIYMDLNNFKRVNDSFGHSVGDRVLKVIADVLERTLRPFDGPGSEAALARLSGDEFVILVRDREPRARALAVANACCKALGDAISCGPVEFYATPSVGIATYPKDGSDVETLLKHADTARHQAKGSGASSVTLYTPAMSARLRDLLDLEMRLRRAVREGALGMCLQPKFRLTDNQIVGVEALARWCDPELGDIPPTRFIQCAEESGLIVDVGTWMMQAVCQQLRSWFDRGISMPVAINLSGKELIFGEPARALEAELKKHHLPASLVEIEITESVFVADSSAGRKSIEQLRSLGCRIALDDFGTGYSSLAYLTRFPPDRLKIDGSFVRNVDQSPCDAGIVEAIMALARTLELTVTAEGVERRGQLEWLISHGCHEAQGYLLARPIPAHVFAERYLRARQNSAADLKSVSGSQTPYP